MLQLSCDWNSLAVRLAHHTHVSCNLVFTLVTLVLPCRGVWRGIEMIRQFPWKVADDDRLDLKRTRIRGVTSEMMTSDVTAGWTVNGLRVYKACCCATRVCTSTELRKIIFQDYTSIQDRLPQAHLFKSRGKWLPRRSKRDFSSMAK
jgi:hypothetical protein